MAVYRPRIADTQVAGALRRAGALVIEGARGTGKTSLAMQVAASSVRLDRDPAALATIDVDPALVLSGPPPMLIDEWQLAGTRLWNFVRGQVDDLGGFGQYILTGSSSPDEDTARHTGAGRFARMRLRTMSLAESGHSSGQVSLAELMAGAPCAPVANDVPMEQVAAWVARGGWPGSLDLPDGDAALFVRDYVETVIDRDLATLGGGRRDPVRIRRYLQATARNVAMDHKMARLAAETEGSDGPIARSTAYDLHVLLERAMVLENQPAWDPNLRSRARLRTSERTHFVDPSIAAAVLGADAEGLLADIRTLGLLFESMVIRDLRVYAGAAGGVVSHYRDSNGLEADAIVHYPDGRWCGIEVKLGATHIDAAATTLIGLRDQVTTPPAFLAVVTPSGYGYTRPDGVHVLPLNALTA